MLDMIQVGAISSTHGLKGEVYIYLTSDDPYRFDNLKEVLLDQGSVKRPLIIEYVKYFKGRPIVKFKGLDKIEDVQKLRGCPLVVRREDAIPLEEGEYFIGDLIGCTVYLEDDTILGELVDVLRTGANDVYIVRKSDGKEILIPVIPECVLEKNPENLRIVVHLLPEI
ncbi:MAG TPA: 16S rRNA processing protein RimM [Lachnospiraceae bacterium]|nr:16S rRNA processing protein RimM [Lachnospiraceae bacterium]